MRNWIKRNLITVLMAAGMIAGVLLLLYPSVANYWNSFHQTRAISTYTEAVSNMSAADYKKIINEAREYNERIAESGIKWVMTDAEKDEYKRQLSINGYLEGSSLPVGGESTHCLISGHRGLPSARLFTDIAKMREGDTWTISVLNETLTYECDQIRVVLPDDLSDLQIEEGEDLCTLITCTPYGVNTHRLLVRGHRIPNSNGSADITADGVQIEPIYIAPVLAIPALLLLLIVFLISTRRARRFDPEECKEIYLKNKDL